MKIRNNIKDLEKYRNLSCNHREEIEQSSTCYCLCCGRCFVPSDIEEWTDEEMRALCPNCGVAAVFGDASGIDSREETREIVSLLIK